VDIKLINLKPQIENSFAKISLIVENLGTMPVSDITLELSAYGHTYREIIPLLRQTEVLMHTFSTMISVPSFGLEVTNLPICVEAIVPSVEGYEDIDLTNNIVCDKENTNLTSSSAYPNPASSTINCDILLQHPSNVNISLFNSFGEIIKTDTFEQHSGMLKYSTDASSLAPGLYFMRISTDDENIIHKVEILR
ncbi:MAG: T9SS type A sorting domain-containing protein, partial [Bacteroidales bacterium]|nr:T9SS type A sorting domain-containing protein [Bacteroidales bacterium]